MFNTLWRGIRKKKKGVGACNELQVAGGFYTPAESKSVTTRAHSQDIWLKALECIVTVLACASARVWSSPDKSCKRASLTGTAM